VADLKIGHFNFKPKNTVPSRIRARGSDWATGRLTERWWFVDGECGRESGGKPTAGAAPLHNVEMAATRRDMRVALECQRRKKRDERSREEIAAE